MINRQNPDEHFADKTFTYNDFGEISFIDFDIENLKSRVGKLNIVQGGGLSNAPADTNCKNIPVEMGSGEECLIKNSNIKREYDKMVSLTHIQGSKYILEPLPETDKSIEINKEGLISVHYKWKSKDKLTIEFFYAGGLTNLIIEQQGDDIKRGLFLYAD